MESLHTFLIPSHCSINQAYEEVDQSINQSLTQSSCTKCQPHASPGLHILLGASSVLVWRIILNHKLICNQKKGACRDSTSLLFLSGDFFGVNKDSGTGCALHKGAGRDSVGPEIHPSYTPQVVNPAMWCHPPG